MKIIKRKKKLKFVNIVGTLLIFAVFPMRAWTGTSQIIGKLDWEEIKSDQPNANAVGILFSRTNSFCAGTHLGAGLVVTAAHCAQDFPQRVSFNYPGGTYFDCDHAFKVDTFQDIAIFQCDYDGPSVKIGEVFTKEIYILHNQCNYIKDPYCVLTKKISKGVATDICDRIEHTADTLPGSSGAPIFNSKDELVGIHQGGNLNVEINYGRRFRGSI